VVSTERFRPYRRLVAAQMRAQRSYRASFAIDLAGSVVVSGLDLLTILVIFRVTRRLGGFGFATAFLMATVAGLSFALADLVTGNVEKLRVAIRTGRLDALLVRPLGVLRQLTASDFELRRIGRVLDELVLLVVAIRLAHVPANPASAVLLVMTVLAGAVFFGAFFVAGGTVAFWWIESGEFANGFTYGGQEFTRYPITVYAPIFRRVFAVGLGFAFVAYYPTLTLLGRADPLGAPRWSGWVVAPVAGAAVVLAALIWRTGVRHYRSSGS
jgi:ABC-2 type transport system permease protein